MGAGGSGGAAGGGGYGGSGGWGSGSGGYGSTRSPGGTGYGGGGVGGYGTAGEMSGGAGGAGMAGYGGGGQAGVANSGWGGAGGSAGRQPAGGTYSNDSQGHLTYSSPAAALGYKSVDRMTAVGGNGTVTKQGVTYHATTRYIHGEPTVIMTRVSSPRPPGGVSTVPGDMNDLNMNYTDPGMLGRYHGNTPTMGASAYNQPAKQGPPNVPSRPESPGGVGAVNKNNMGRPSNLGGASGAQHSNTGARGDRQAH